MPAKPQTVHSKKIDPTGLHVLRMIIAAAVPVPALLSVIRQGAAKTAPGLQVEDRAPK